MLKTRKFIAKAATVIECGICDKIITSGNISNFLRRPPVFLGDY
jgi:hypothetical protein